MVGHTAIRTAHQHAEQHPNFQSGNQEGLTTSEGTCSSNNITAENSWRPHENVWRYHHTI